MVNHFGRLGYNIIIWKTMFTIKHYKKFESRDFKYNFFFYENIHLLRLLESLPELLISPLRALAAQKTAVSPGFGRLS